MPYGLTDAQYAAEVDRKQSAGIPLTGSFDQAAYNRGKAQLGGTSSSTPLTPSSPSGSTSGYAPIRSTLQNLGYSVTYDPSTRNISVSNGSVSGVITPNMYTAYNNTSYMSPASLQSFISSLNKPSAPLVPELPELPKLELPEYKPYEYRPYQQTTPLIPITSNPNDTVYTPTLNAISAWNEQEARNAEQAYQKYLADYNNAYNTYKSAYDVWSTQLDNALQAEQIRREYEEKEAARLAEQNKTTYERAWQKYVEAGYNSLTPEERQLLGITGPSLAEQNIKSTIANRNRPKTTVNNNKPTNSINENTKDFLANIMKFRTREYADAYLSRNYATAAANGVDMDYILKKMNERWGVGLKSPPY